MLRERPSWETVRNIVNNVIETTEHALRCRAAAAIGAYTAIRLDVDTPTPHDIDPTATAAEQARDEREQVRRSRSFMSAFRTASRSRAARLEDDAREAAMATRLAALRGDAIVAVVGIDHLDPLVERLDGNDSAEAT